MSQVALKQKALAPVYTTPSVISTHRVTCEITAQNFLEHVRREYMFRTIQTYVI